MRAQRPVAERCDASGVSVADVVGIWLVIRK